MPDFETILKEKDGEIERLKHDLEISKRGATQTSYSALVKKIEMLQKEIEQKDTELRAQKKLVDDFQKTSSAADLQTKIIVLQSKVRQKDIKIRDMTEELNKKDKKVEALEKIQESEGGGVNVPALKIQNQELETQVKSLRQQVISLNEKAERVDALQKQVVDLQELFTQAKAASAVSSAQSGTDPAQSTALQGEIQKREEQIAILQQKIKLLENGAGNPAASGVSVSSGPGGSYMSQRRVDMRVRELESQVEMLKRSELQMRQQYQEAMRKLSSKDEFSW